MFCKNCGREIPENAKFCSGCGTPVSAPEQPPEVPGTPVQPPVQEGGAPQDELTAALESAAETAVAVAPVPEIQPVTPVQPGGASAAPVPKKKKTGLIVLAAVVAAAAVLAALLILFLPSGGGKDTLVYLTDDDELMFRKDLKAKTEAVELTDEETDLVRFTQDGKYIYFWESDGDTSTMYRMETAKIGKKDASPEKISSDVSPYGVSLLPSGGAVYVRGSGSDGQLRCYDGKESYKLASGVSSYGFTVDEKGTYAYYTELDDSDYTTTLYRVQIKQDGEREKILKDAGTIYTSYDASVLVYGRFNGDSSSDWAEDGTYDIYSQVPGGEKTKLLSEVSDVLDVAVDGGKISLVYLTAQVEEHTLYDFVTDSLASSDVQEQEPDYEDYQVRSSWGWMTTDWDAYEADYEAWLEVDARNYIRQSLQETPYNVTTYELKRYVDGETVLLASDLAFYPTYSAEEEVYLYAKSEQEVSAVCDVQDLEYWGDVYEKMTAAGRTWYQNIGGTESAFDLDEGSGIGELYVLNGSEAVLTVYEDGESLLQAYSLDKNGLTFLSTITDDAYGSLSVGKSGSKDALYYFTDVDEHGDASSGELMRYAGGTKTSMARDAARVILLDDGKTVFKLEDMEYDDRRGGYECSLCVVKDGKSQRIADEADPYSIAYLDAKRVVYISDGDLFVWDGSGSEKLASGVEDFWTVSQAGYQTCVCGW